MSFSLGTSVAFLQKMQVSYLLSSCFSICISLLLSIFARLTFPLSIPLFSSCLRPGQLPLIRYSFPAFIRPSIAPSLPEAPALPRSQSVFLPPQSRSARSACASRLSQSAFPFLSAGLPPHG